VVHQHLALQGVANLDTLSFWCFSDIFEEGGFISQPYHGGFGMQTIYGVPKPVLNAFGFIAQSPATAAAITAAGGGVVVVRVNSVSVDNVDVQVTYEDDAKTALRSVVALVTNFNTVGNPITNRTLILTFANVARPPTPATITLIDDAHGFALPVWQAYGSPLYPAPAEVADEVAVATLAPVAVVMTATGPNTYALPIALLPYAVAQVTFQF